MERAVRAGIVVVAAAGNFGKTAEGKTVYGGDHVARQQPVGADGRRAGHAGTPQRSDDTVATYSSKGPTRYDLVLKPDLVAPGSHIVSAEAQGRTVDGRIRERHVAGSGADALLRLSGTSMAAGGGERGGGAAAAGAAEADAGESEGGAAADELVHAGGGAAWWAGRGA